MKFEEAFNIVFEKEDRRAKAKGLGGFKVSSATAKILAFFWNIMAVSQNVLDDFAFVVDNNGVFDIQSIPIDIDAKGSRKKGKDDKTPKVDAEKDEPITDNTDGEEEEQDETESK